ncbi:MerR family transcriptional regulator [Celeribacter baekdonensis]|uniref:MerR family transcriptional regulator n=1 Tax=Celeribacter baekdonensis TaxID=875171 RepID=A0A2R4M089_9RHOB|nr:MerR family transcriptional regulator [Celeribacter baekdonensis]AVW90571.1 MerR family transcriptional regulator [Celeribacter baekdonensis]|tara:strand:+ start:72991 stop:73440 length:450 start_codon:yes stop_codon:yes gene_type:complete
MKIGDLAKRTGITAHTIRYYERIGLLPYAHRDGSGRRDYGEDSVVWIGFLSRLKTTGMPIRDMLRYAKLRAQGDSTGPARAVLLSEHRDRVRAHLAELHSALTVLDTKIAGYGETERMDQNDADPNDTDHTRGNTTDPIGARQGRLGRD